MTNTPKLMVLVAVAGMAIGVVLHSHDRGTEAIENPKAVMSPSQQPPAAPVAALPGVVEGTDQGANVEFLADPGIVPASMKAIMGEGEKQAHVTRTKAVAALGHDISSDEINALYVLMNRKEGEDPLPAGGLNVLRNEALNALTKQRELPPDLVSNLVAMFNDRTHDALWRDYCIQGLGTLIKRIEHPRQKELACATLWAATRESATHIGGTGLIALRYNVDDSAVSADAVKQRALALVQDSSCGVATKTTALQVCAQLGGSDVLPKARELAKSAPRPVLRMSAIAAVGTLGDRQDLALLETCAADSDRYVRTAANSALKRLRDR